LARELERVGLGVEACVLIDPVFRHPCPLKRWTSLLSRETLLLRAPVIRLPRNVRRVWVFYQRRNLPQGHKVEVRDGTELLGELELRRTHQEMDNAVEAHEACLEAALGRGGDMPKWQAGRWG
jgi:hypothetical protein